MATPNASGGTCALSRDDQCEQHQPFLPPLTRMSFHSFFIGCCVAIQFLLPTAFMSRISTTSAVVKPRE
jgi:hypothetical protein